MKRITKRLLSFTCAAALLASLAACGASSSSTSTDEEDSTVTGQVLSIDGTTVTLQLGTLNENAGGAPHGTPPDKPDGSSDSGTDDQTPPAKPEDASDSTNAPEAPAGDASGSGNGQTPPEQPSGNGGDVPSGMPGGSFTAGDESMTLDLADAALTKDGETISTEDLAVDDILTVTLNASGKATTAEVVTTNGMGGAHQCQHHRHGHHRVRHHLHLHRR